MAHCGSLWMAWLYVTSNTAPLDKAASVWRHRCNVIAVNERQTTDCPVAVRFVLYIASYKEKKKKKRVDFLLPPTYIVSGTPTTIVLRFSTLCSKGSSVFNKNCERRLAISLVNPRKPCNYNSSNQQVHKRWGAEGGSKHSDVIRNTHPGKLNL